MLVLGIDPGPTKAGWALIDAEGTTARYMQGGWECCDEENIVRWICGFDRGDLIAIEIPGLVVRDAAKHSLVETARWAGFAQGFTYLRSTSIVLTAQQWRKELTGKPNASDALIHEALRPRITDLPKRCSVHIRDAVGVALVGHWQYVTGARRSA